MNCHPEPLVHKGLTHSIYTPRASPPSGNIDAMLAGKKAHLEDVKPTEEGQQDDLGDDRSKCDNDGELEIVEVTAKLGDVDVGGSSSTMIHESADVISKTLNGLAVKSGKPEERHQNSWPDEHVTSNPCLGRSHHQRVRLLAKYMAQPQYPLGGIIGGRLDSVNWHRSRLQCYMASVNVCADMECHQCQRSEHTAFYEQRSTNLCETSPLACFCTPCVVEHMCHVVATTYPTLVDPTYSLRMGDMVYTNYGPVQCSDDPYVAMAQQHQRIEELELNQKMIMDVISYQQRMQTGMQEELRRAMQPVHQRSPEGYHR